MKCFGFLVLFSIGCLHVNATVLQSTILQSDTYTSLASNLYENNLFYEVHTYSDHIVELKQIIAIRAEDTPLKEVLEEIAGKAGLGIAYNAELQALNRPVNLDFQRISVGDALLFALKGSRYEPAISKTREIVLLPKATPEVPLEPDEKTVDVYQEVVEGQVSDATTEQSLPGVNIVVQGTNMGTVTDADGNFSLSVPSLNESLVISYIGYQAQEIALEGRTTLDVVLQPLVISGQEMVVTAFGLQREQRSLSYSTQGVDTETLTEARELNVMNSLQGKVAGLAINQAGSGVGAPTRVILRGNRSISGDSQPLYVIDGVPIRGNPEDLNPDNIQSINVLKGPNAAALYGSAAQNGAIVIETTQPQSGVVDVSLSNTFQVQNPILSIPFQNQYGQGVGGNYTASSEESWGPRMEGQMVDHWSFDPADAGRQYSLTPQPNNVRDGFQRGFNTATNLSASVGVENIQGVFSYTRTDARGIVPGNELAKNNVMMRIVTQLTDDVTLDGKVDYMQQGIENAFSQGENNFNPMRQLYRMPRNIRTGDATHFEYVSPEGIVRQNFWNPGSTNGYNPYYLLNRAVSEDTRERVIATTSLRYDISEQLNFMIRTSYDGANNNGDEKLYRDFYARAPEGRYTISRSDAQQLNSDFLFSYTEDISEDWLINANFGGSIEQQRNSSLNSGTGEGLLVSNFFALSNTLDDQSSYNPGNPEDTRSLYSFGQIGWRDAIYLDITGRNDWSSTLPEESRSYFYPSVGLSVVLSDIIPSLPETISFAKVRTSWAQVGNSAPPYMLNRTASFQGGGNQGYLALNSTLPNPDLKPEMTESVEAGLDVRLFNGRLGFDVTVYKMNTYDQLFTIALPVGSGAGQYFTNGGDVENKGLEVLLSTTPVQGSILNWDMDFNFGLNRNMVNEISDERPRVGVGGDTYMREYVVEQGKPFGEVYSRGFLRDDQGRVIVDPDGIPRSSGSRATKVANFNPDWTGSISSMLSYRNFSGSFLIDHRQGGTSVSLTNAILYGDGQRVETLQGREGGLVFGENVFSDETAVLDDGTPNNIEVNAQTLWRNIGGRNAPIGEAFVEDATSTKLREITLGYNLPRSVLDPLGVSNIKISLVARNLLFIYRASDSLDPDFLVGTGTIAEGFQSFAPPTTRTYGVNFQIDL
ncbi:MAG: SusC/RagA family TonB-linked outer membrane protein [Balneolaceae bacterium]